MAVKLICVVAQSFNQIATPQDQSKKQKVRAAFERLAAEVKAYDPTLIITFGPDHFNGFFL